MVPYQQITEKSIRDALNAVLNDPSYTNRAREFGALAVDQIEHPLIRATWWLEHIMRHPKEYRNKSPVFKLAWYQYFSLDVIAVLAFAFLLIIYTICRIIKFCFLSKSEKDKRE